MKKYLNQLVIIYEKTTSFHNGGVGRIMDLDQTSRGEVSFFVLPMEFDGLEGIDRLNNSRWVKKSDIKQIVTINRPNKFIKFLKQLMFWRL